jgi:glutathione S-transferase
MELYGSYTSPFVRHCRIVLLESGLDFKFVEATSTDTHNPSPTKKVPYLRDGDLGFSDSSSIIKHVRDKVGQPFLPDTREFDLYCFVNTLMDAAINVFLFEKVDGLHPTESKYLTRQVARVESGLTDLEGQALGSAVPGSDAHIRLACFLAWGLFRRRFDLTDRRHLVEFLRRYDAWPAFSQTAPPQSA